MNGRRFIIFATAVILASTAAFSGCLSAGKQFTKPEAPPSNQSVVYFYRGNNMMTNTTSPGILHNGTEVLDSMFSQGYWKYYISPGVHLFEPKQFGIYKAGPLTLTNETPGQTYYVEVEVSVGYIGFKRQSKSTGLAEISECFEIDSSPRSQAAPSAPASQGADTSNKIQAETPAKVEAPKTSAAGPGSLHVATHPGNALVRIMNIKPKFYQGIELVQGKYHIEVSAQGYITQSKWVTLSKGEALSLNITLLPEATTTITPPAEPVKTTKASSNTGGTKITDPEIAEVARMLTSDTPALKRNAAKITTNIYPGQPQLLELAVKELEKGYNTRLTNSVHVDAMAWLCKAIGASGNSEYKTFLTTIANQTHNSKIRKYALKSAQLL
jgi:hypothetical protein